MYNRLLKFLNSSSSSKFISNNTWEYSITKYNLII